MREIETCIDEASEQASLDVYNAVWPHDAITIDEVRSFKAGASASIDYLARDDGIPAGSAVGAIFPQRADHVFTIVTVLDAHRRRGIGSSLCDAVLGWAAGQGLNRLEIPVLAGDAESLAFAHKRGFVEERRELGVVLDLAGLDPPQVEPPAGVEIVGWADRPELARGMYKVALEAVPDIPGYEDWRAEPFDEWLAHDMQGSGDRPEATFVAIAGDEVVGFAKFSLTAAQPRIAHHDLSGVKRAWRRRGIAAALKAAQIGWAIANGYEELHTRNDERNEPIRRLNARFGYRPGLTRVYVVGPAARAR